MLCLTNQCIHRQLDKDTDKYKNKSDRQTETDRQMERTLDVYLFRDEKTQTDRQTDIERGREE